MSESWTWSCDICGRDYKQQTRASYFCRRTDCPALSPTVLPPVCVSSSIWYDEGGRIRVTLHLAREEDKPTVYVGDGATVAEATADAVRVMLLDHHTAEFVARK